MEKAKLKRFIDCYVPVTTCNFRCHYCYITQLRKFDDKLPTFKYSPEYIAKALSKERLGGVCCLNFCGGGETLLPPEVVPIIRALLEEGHFVMVVTNGSMTKRFEEISTFPKELLERLFFKFSFHYLELKRMNMLDRFFGNLKLMRDSGCSFSLEITPNDELIPHIEDIKEIALKEVKALPHITVARDNTKKELPILTSHSKKEYKKIWGQFHSKLFEYKLSVFNKKRKEFCYAGAWSAYLNIGTGILKQCYKGQILQNIYKDLNEPINFCPIGNNCLQSHCYNAHAWLTFGDIPKHKAPFYNEIRDRVCTDGTHWCNKTMREFLSQKLKDNNDQYNLIQRMKFNKIARKYQGKNSFIENIFSIKNIQKDTCKKYKVITILGIKIKIKTKIKKKPLKQLQDELAAIKENQKKLQMYLNLERFDRYISKVAPKDNLIFVCLNGLGDTMLYASYTKELEEKYGAKIFWVAPKSHEVVFKMYNITNYLCLDYISMHKQGKWSDYVNMTTTPEIGIPFYAHWTYNKGSIKTKITYFLDFVRNSLNLTDIPLNHPVWYPELKEELKNKIKELNNTILISPEARWLPIDDASLWNDLIKKLNKEGYEVVINNFLHKINLEGNFICENLSSEELVSLSKSCFATISPRSGFCDIMHELGEKLFVLYTDEQTKNLFTLNEICSTKNVNEYVYSKEFNTDKIIEDIKKLKAKKNNDSRLS